MLYLSDVDAQWTLLKVGFNIQRHLIWSVTFIQVWWETIWNLLSTIRTYKASSAKEVVIALIGLEKAKMVI